ncbi:MAG TPA: RsiV family protein [Guyparkeria sp.]|nr:RsiV family protein [Guyparkeria sp.]
MRRILRAVTLTSLAGALLLSGCENSTPLFSENDAATATPANPSSARAATTAPAARDALPGDHAQTPRYRIDINYPDLPASEAVLAKVLRATGDNAKREFMQGLPDPGRLPEFANRQLAFMIDFSVATRLPRFVSVREQGMADTGGAHPIPIDGSVVYDTKAGKIIALDDLFTHPEQALERLSKLSRETLGKKLLAETPSAEEAPPEVRQQWLDSMRSMIHDGTEPEKQNFSEFMLLADIGGQAAGLQLIFPPYQVAPYVYGTQTVDVPVDVFADLLKPPYREAFDRAADGS